MVATACSWACKPAPLPVCTNFNFKVNLEKFDELFKHVNDFQRILDTHIVEPRNRTSCFNNHITIHYAALLQEQLKHNKGSSCREVTQKVRNGLGGLSAELQHVPDEKVRVKLRKLHEIINTSSKKLL
jgi:hypothetical protein